MQIKMIRLSRLTVRTKSVVNQSAAIKNPAIQKLVTYVFFFLFISLFCFTLFAWNEQIKRTKHAEFAPCKHHKSFWTTNAHSTNDVILFHIVGYMLSFGFSKWNEKRTTSPTSSNCERERERKKRKTTTHTHSINEMSRGCLEFVNIRWTK